MSTIVIIKTPFHAKHSGCHWKLFHDIYYVDIFSYYWRLLIFWHTCFGVTTNGGRVLSLYSRTCPRVHLLTSLRPPSQVLTLGWLAFTIAHCLLSLRHGQGVKLVLRLLELIWPMKNGFPCSYLCKRDFQPSKGPKGAGLYREVTTLIKWYLSILCYILLVLFPAE